MNWIRASLPVRQAGGGLAILAVLAIAIGGGAPARAQTMGPVGLPGARITASLVDPQTHHLLVYVVPAPRRHRWFRVWAARLPAGKAGAEPQAPGAWMTAAGMDGLARVALKVAADGTLATGPDPGGPVVQCSGACVVIGGMNGLTPVALKVGADGTVASSGGTSAFGPNYSIGGGVAQAQTVAPTTAVTNATLVDGYVICWLPVAANSGPGATLAGSGSSTFSAHTITKYGTLPLIANDINPSTKNPRACAIYDAADAVFQLLNPLAGIIAQTSFTAVGPAAGVMNLPVSGACDSTGACTGNFWGIQGLAAMPGGSLQYTPSATDGAPGDAMTTDGSQHWNWSVQRRTLTGTAYTNATTTFSNVVGSAGQTLQFTVAASANYKIACDIEWQGSANTTGPKWQWTGPASPTALVQYAHNPVTTSTYLDAVGSKTAFSSPMADTGTITAATDFVSHLDLELVNGVNAGTVVLQAAANGVGTLTIQPGSSCVSNGDK